MRMKTLAALTFAATLTLFSCNWFTSKHASPLVGKWQLTGVTDSSAAGLKGTSFFSGFNPDSSHLTVAFNADSTTVLTSAEKHESDTTMYLADLANNKIFVKGVKDLKYDTFAIKSLTDTFFTAIKDSVYFQLKRLP